MKLTLLFAGCFIALSGGFFQVILGSSKDLEENDFSTIKLIEKYGYPAESHEIETEDGYFLQMQRIPYGRNSTGTSSRQPFLFVHGIYTTSTAFLGMGLNSLPFLLADRGYDVWLGNFRGTQYGKRHRSLSPKSSEFWNFSFHEVGLYDLPAKIDYICNHTQRDNVTLLGHSFGNSVQMIMATERPDYQKKVRASVLIAAPSIFHKEKKILPVFAPMYPLMAHFIFRFYTSSTSVKVLAHYFQFGLTGKIRQYDYGPVENLRKYKSPKPPAYNLESITIPMALVYATNDVFGCKEDSEYLLKRMKNIKMALEVKDKTFSHLHFQYGENIKEIVYDKVLEFVEKLEKL